MLHWMMLCLIAFVAGGCSLPLPSEGPGGDSVSETRLWWIQPRTGDVLTGSVLMEAGVEIEEPVESVTFLVDGSSWETVRNPPWISEWTDPEPGFHELGFIVAGSRFHYESTSIDVDLETTQRMFIGAPTADRWQSNGILDSLSVETCPGTREPGGSLLWSAGMASWVGRRFPLSHLSPGVHRISVEGSSGERAFVLGREVEIVELSPSESPEKAWRDLLSALRIRNSEELGERLSDEMIFVPCTRGFDLFASSSNLDRTEFIRRLESLWRDHAGPLAWHGRIDRIDRWPLPTPDTALLEINSLELSAGALADCASESDAVSPVAPATLRIRSRVLTRKFGDLWKVVQWSERGELLSG